MRYFKLVLKVSLGMICTGLVLGSIGYFMGGKRSFSKNNIVSIVSDDTKRIIQTKELEDFNNINIDVKLDYIELIESDKNKIELNYSEDMNEVSYKVDGKSLSITQPARNSIGLNIDLRGFTKKNLNYMKLYIADTSVLENITIDTGDSDIKISDISSNTLDIDSDYGDIELINVKLDKAKIVESDGDLIFDNVKISSIFDLQNKYGSVDIMNSEFNKFIATLEDGDFNLLSSESKVSQIKNNYGDIIIKFNEDEKLYDYSIDNKYGDVKVGNASFEGTVTKNNNGIYILDIISRDGNVDVDFKNQ